MPDGPEGGWHDKTNNTSLQIRPICRPDTLVRSSSNDADFRAARRAHEVAFDNWYVSGESLIGGEGGLGRGFRLQMEGFENGRLQTASDTDDLILLVVGAKDGYVKRDGHMVDPADIERRAAFGQ